MCVSAQIYIRFVGRCVWVDVVVGYSGLPAWYIFYQFVCESREQLWACRRCRTPQISGVGGGG